jgi:hypothetical protein
MPDPKPQHPLPRRPRAPKPTRVLPRRFLLQRDEDVSGVSGTGVVAEGTKFSNGKVVMTWLSATPTVTVYESLDAIERIHGHDGRTKLEWIDS